MPHLPWRGGSDDRDQRRRLGDILGERGSRASSTDQDARCHRGMDGYVRSMNKAELRVSMSGTPYVYGHCLASEKNARPALVPRLDMGKCVKDVTSLKCTLHDSLQAPVVFPSN